MLKKKGLVLKFTLARIVYISFPACGIVYVVSQKKVYVKCQASSATLQINVWCSVGFIVTVCKSLMSIA
jgi:hypothetical protein